MPFLRCMAGRIRLAPFNDGNETKRSEEMGSSFAATHCATMVRASAHRIDEPNLTTASLPLLTRANPGRRNRRALEDPKVRVCIAFRQCQRMRGTN